MKTALHVINMKQEEPYSGMSHQITRRAVRFLSTVVLFGFLLITSVIGVNAETKSLLWNRLDVDISVQSNGDLQVVETNVIDFTSGIFTFGYRDINQNRLSQIKDVKVTQDSSPIKYETSTTDAGDFRIKYYFPEARNEIRTFKLSYTVIGATRYYTNGDVIYWAPVYAARNGFSVQDSRTTVRLPAGATALLATTFGPSATVTGQGESLVIAEAKEPIRSGKQLEVLVSIPHGILSGSAPSWQADYDQEQQSRVVGQSVSFGFLLVGLLLIFGGPALIVLWWYTRGRDPSVGMMAEYLNEPPPGITPGMAGTLIDGSADQQDLIATVVDLGRRGVLSLKEQGQANVAGIVVSRDYLVSRGTRFKSEKLATYEAKLIDAMRLNDDTVTTLSAISGKLFAQTNYIKGAMYDELIRLGIYTYKPDGSRSRYTLAGIILLIFACITGCAVAWISTTYDLTELCPAVGIGLNAVLLLIVAKKLQARTRKGAEVRMRVEAFRRYLQNIEKYTDIKSAQALFDRYLPYAIAFGLDRTWIQKFSTVPTPAPSWYIPFDIGSGMKTNRTLGAQSIVNVGSAIAHATPLDISNAASAPVTMDSINDGLSSGLSDVNKGLASMFSSVSASFLNKPLGAENAIGAAAHIASSAASSSSSNGADTAKAGVEIAGAILGAVLDIATGGGGSSGGGSGGFG